MRALMLAVLAVRVWGCSCFAPGPACQEAWESAAVFTGTVLNIFEPPLLERAQGVPLLSNRGNAEELARRGATVRAPFLRRSVHFQIAEALAGAAAGKEQINIQTGLGGGDCGYPFRRGETYLVYARRLPEGTLETGICTRTKLLTDAGEDLTYFRALATAASGSEIRFLAFDVHGGWRHGSDGKVAATGIRSVKTTIEGPGGRLSASTDGSGRHTFAGLPAGEYKLAAALEGWVPASPLKPVLVHEKGCAEVLLAMKLDRRITGRVRAADGRPAAGVIIETVRTRPLREHELPFAADSARTDAQGRYELRNLGAGDYYLGVNLDTPPTLEHPYARWFFPGTSDSSLAAILRVPDEPGEQQYDLTLPPRQKESVIEGVVYWPGGRPGQGVIVTLRDLGYPWRGPVAMVRTEADGHFVLRAFDGTRYCLQADSPAQSFGQDSWAEPVEVQAGGSHLQLRLILGHKGSRPVQKADKQLERWRSGMGL